MVEKGSVLMAMLLGGLYILSPSHALTLDPDGAAAAAAASTAAAAGWASEAPGASLPHLVFMALLVGEACVARAVHRRLVKLPAASSLHEADHNL